MLYTEIKPGSFLKDYISCYAIIDNSSNEEINKHFRIIPEGNFQLVIYYNDDNYIDLNNSHSTLPDNPIIGPLTSFRIFKAIGKVGLFSIAFKAEGLSLLVNDSVRGLNDNYFPVSDLNRFTNELSERIIEAPNNAERVKLANIILGDFFAHRAKSKINFPVHKVIDFIGRKQGVVGIKDLAYRFNCSVSKLERKFKEVTSLTPKKYAQIIRMQNAIRRGFLYYGDMLDIAISSGYYDQSHFSHDFKKMIGSMPKKFFHSDEYYKRDFLIQSKDDKNYNAFL